MTEFEMVGWYHRLNGHEQALGDGGHGGLRSTVYGSQRVGQD